LGLLVPLGRYVPLGLLVPLGLYVPLGRHAGDRPRLGSFLILEAAADGGM